MELLGEFFEKDADIIPDEGACYHLRKAARAVVFNHAGEVALIFVAQHGYHKLPGGGVERGEDLETALRREVREEIGGGIEIRAALGVVIEYRDQSELLQISYGFLADLIGDPAAVALTVEEKSRGFELGWVSMDYALQIMQSDTPADDVGHFIKQRDLLFLRKAQELRL